MPTRSRLKRSSKKPYSPYDGVAVDLYTNKGKFVKTVYPKNSKAGFAKFFSENFPKYRMHVY